MKKFFILLSTNLCLFFVTTNAFLYSKKIHQTTLRLHQFLPKSAAIPKYFIDPWIEKVEKESKGKIKIKHYPSMQLGGSPPNLIRQVKDGTVDIVWTLLGYTPGRFLQAESFELPFIMTTSEATSKAFQEYYQRYLREEFKEYKIIAVHTHGPGLFHTKRPVSNLSDLKGMKLRTPSRITTKIIQSLGAIPIGMPVSQVPSALSKGVIDGAIIPWGVSLAIKSSELLKNHMEFSGTHGLYTATFIFAMNFESYRLLHPNLKKVIDNNSGMETAAWAGRVQGDDDVAGRKHAVELNNNIITLTPQQTNQWKERLSTIKDQWIKEMNEKGYSGKKLYSETLRLIKKHTD